MCPSVLEERKTPKQDLEEDMANNGIKIDKYS
jgi:hypothetical protein